MSLLRKTLADQTNPNQSAGPKTAGPVRQGLLNCRTIALSLEDSDKLTTIHADYLAQFRPTTSAELLQVETMVYSEWRLRRAWVLEPASINYIIEAQAAELDERAPGIDNATRAAFAFSELTEETRLLDSYQRLENNLQRRWDQAHRNLIKLRDPRSNLTPPSGFPIGGPLTTSATVENDFCTTEPNVHDPALDESADPATGVTYEFDFCTTEPNNHHPALDENLDPAAGVTYEFDFCTTEPNDHHPALDESLDPAAGTLLPPPQQYGEPKRPSGGAVPNPPGTHIAPGPPPLRQSHNPDEPPKTPASTQTGTSAPEPPYP